MLNGRVSYGVDTNVNTEAIWRDSIAGVVANLRYQYSRR